MKDKLNEMKGKIFVSCQGYDLRTFHSTKDMLDMGNAAMLGGCFGFRVNSPENVKQFKERYPNYPIIGIYKIEYDNSEVYITPTVEAVEELVNAGADIVALDCTARKNHKNLYGWETLKLAKEKFPNTLFMADCSTFYEARQSCIHGADIVSTTMSGYTSYTLEKNNCPDYEMLKECKENLDAFVMCEGKIWSREDALNAFKCGADAIVVGTAITNPMMITERFVKYIKENKIWE